MFGKLFGKGKKEVSATTPAPEGFAVLQDKDWQSLEELLEQHAGLSFEKQLSFGELIGECSWQVDMASGQIQFGDDLSFPFQILGSLSFEDNSWLWGWANEASQIPAPLLSKAQALREAGTQKGIEALHQPHIETQESFEHAIGLAACGYFDSKSYYCANYGKGTLVLLIDGDEIPAPDPERLEKVLTVYPQLISSIPINHYNALQYYLAARGFLLKTTPLQIEAWQAGRTITASFDEQGRLTNLNGTL